MRSPPNSGIVRNARSKIALTESATEFGSISMLLDVWRGNAGESTSRPAPTVHPGFGAALPVSDQIAEPSPQWHKRGHTFRHAAMEHTRMTTTTNTVEYPPNPTVDRASLPPGPSEWPVVDQSFRYLFDLIRGAGFPHWRHLHLQAALQPGDSPPFLEKTGVRLS